jgi:hypothetical protein
MSEAKNIEKHDADVTAEIVFADLEEQVSLAGATPRQLTGQEAGRVLGFGCD